MTNCFAFKILNEKKLFKNLHLFKFCIFKIIYLKTVDKNLKCLDLFSCHVADVASL